MSIAAKLEASDCKFMAAVGRRYHRLKTSPEFGAGVLDFASIVGNLYVVSILLYNFRYLVSGISRSYEKVLVAIVPSWCPEFVTNRRAFLTCNLRSSQSSSM